MEQLRPPINRGESVTDAERDLAKMADKSFLNLWSYASPYRDKKAGGQTTGKELCDLLVVCAPHIIIFSEKTIGWQANKDSGVAWPRWFKAAVWESVKQIRGAERWIKEFPDRIFLDRECTTRLPLALPPADERIIHRVVVAQGVSAAVRAHFGEGSGSLLIKPAIVGEQHFKTHNYGNDIEPFAIGDVDPNEPFVHVLDETALDIVMRELDTISDFTAYLQKKEAFIRSGRLKTAAGEENLLAYYAVYANDKGDHDFIPPSGGAWPEGATLDIGDTEYAKLVADPQYTAKKRADEQSYVWDRLIEVFTKPLLDGTSIVPEGFAFDLQKSELGVRYMALETRFQRRTHAAAIVGAWERGKKIQKFFRMMLDEGDSTHAETAFFMLTFNYESWMETYGYDDYRMKRASMAAVYARTILMERLRLKRVVGISMECPGRGVGGSEEMVFALQKDWTDEERAENEKERAAYMVMQPNMKATRFRAQEYPDVEEMRVDMLCGKEFHFTDSEDALRQLGIMQRNANAERPVNRQQRRAAERAARRNRYRDRA